MLVRRQSIVSKNPTLSRVVLSCVELSCVGESHELNRNTSPGPGRCWQRDVGCYGSWVLRGPVRARPSDATCRESDAASRHTPFCTRAHSLQGCPQCPPRPRQLTQLRTSWAVHTWKWFQKIYKHKNICDSTKIPFVMGRVRHP